MKQGFTLIELLVVIAIIGILSSVVLTSLDSGTSAAYDASAKLVLSQLQSAGVIYGATNKNNYTDFCDGTDIKEILKEATYQLNRGTAGDHTKSGRLTAGTLNSKPVYCVGIADKWAVVVKLTGEAYYCIDSKGRPQEGTLPTVADIGSGMTANIETVGACK